jgi:Rod binding domain-containing protein
VDPKNGPLPGLPDPSGDAARHALEMKQLRQRLTAGATDEKKLREACQDFEAIFIHKIWKQMRKSVPKEGYLHSREEEMYLSMFDEELSRKMASAGGIGLGDILYDQLSRQLKDAGSDTGGTIRPLDRSPGAAAGAAEASAVQPEEAEQEAREPLGVMALADALADRVLKERAAAGAAVEAYGGGGSAGTPLPVDGGVALEGAGAREGMMIISGDRGAPVRSLWDGEVVFAGSRQDMGEVVVLEHGPGWRTVYGNLGSSSVSEGQVVKAGRKIAELGGENRSQEPVLHFQVIRDGRPVDPREALEALRAAPIKGRKA